MRDTPIGKVGILFLARNRRTFTETSLSALIEYTNPDLVDRILLLDGGSEDGTRQMLFDFAKRGHPDFDIRFRGGTIKVVVESYKHILATSKAPYIVKIDNDLVVCPNWLDISLGIVESNPKIGFLGFIPHDPIGLGPYQPSIVGHIGGVAIYPRHIFRGTVLSGSNTYYGMQPFIKKTCIAKNVKAAWIKPGLPMFVLDRLPIEPWKGISKGYTKMSYQRPWKSYKPEDRSLWDWYFDQPHPLLGELPCRVQNSQFEEKSLP